jgi:hypothetical protein
MKDVIILLIPLLGMLLITYLILQHFFNKSLKENQKELMAHKNESLLPLKMQAYERAILFLERIDPNNMVIRVHKSGMNATSLHVELLKIIREEYTHNMSQQIYISPNSWRELVTGKEETIQLINTSINQLTNKSNGIELSAKIFENIAQRKISPSEKARLVIIREFQKSMNA